MELKKGLFFCCRDCIYILILVGEIENIWIKHLLSDKIGSDEKIFMKN